jgi:hypothetical protein
MRESDSEAGRKKIVRGRGRGRGRDGERKRETNLIIRVLRERIRAGQIIRFV